MLYIPLTLLLGFFMLGMHASIAHSDEPIPLRMLAIAGMQ